MTTWEHSAKRAIVAIVSAILGHLYIDLVAPHTPVSFALWALRTGLWILVIFLALLLLYHWENGQDDD
jgi:hypothetical protein